MSIFACCLSEVTVLFVLRLSCVGEGELWEVSMFFRVRHSCFEDVL